MTCIVGLIDRKKNNVIIGADSAATTDEMDISYLKNGDKVFKVGKFVVGCSGNFRTMQVIRFSFKPPKVNKKDIYEYMCTDFVSVLKDTIDEYEVEEEFILVGYKDRLFLVEANYQVMEYTEGFCSIGSGDYYAIGSLITTKGMDISAKKRLKIALETASYKNASCAPPYKFVNT